MDIQYFGANCVVINTGTARIVIDDNLADLGGKSVTKAGDVVLFTGPHGLPPQDVKLTVDMPGEYEASDVSIYGIQARAHLDEDKIKTATMYKLIAKDLRILITGHVYPKFKESDLEKIGTVDVMIVPVGGNGYTLDPIGALEMIKEIEPKLIVPTHYADDKLNYPMPSQTLEQALQGLGMEPKDRVTKLKLKSGDLADTTQLVVVEKA
jgi:L-ascorbate metabolism protein UlaG (beta-lactamase superfamily)